MTDYSGYDMDEDEDEVQRAIDNANLSRHLGNDAAADIFMREANEKLEREVLKEKNQKGEKK